MTTRLSNEATTFLRLLEDGQWHPLNDVLTRLTATIAPGKALRRYEANQQYRLKNYGPRQAPDLSMVEQMSSGAKGIATDTLHSLKKRYVEIKDEAGHKWVRRREAPVPVRVRARHVAPIEFRQVPPAPPEPPPATDTEHVPQESAAAFFSETQIRALLVQELGAAVTELRTFITEQLAVLRPAAHRPQPPTDLPAELVPAGRGQLAPLENERHSDSPGL